ncbi:MAG: hypothetical protein PHY34_00810 [Patescibacteria group bacterium]|nr:hypothetical protein [Patescibacteria group bacterium]MDD5715830.1 hypothetical protein [Patescibacteria group bacterium]
MQKKIIEIARATIRRLQLTYPRFINVILDDWRGYRLHLRYR